jgi:hypothetical protein
MSVAVGSLRFNAVELIALNDTKRIDLTNSVVFVDYFEDILSPCVTMNMQIATGNSIFNTLPIRGGEKVVFDISTATGNFTLDGDYGMYVYKVSGYASDGQKEMFTLHLVSREGLTNETSRCQKKYEKLPINEHVTSILDEVLTTKKYESSNIERTSNSYSFIGNQKKPFHILTWLGPKGIPSTGSSGTSGELAKGVAGFLFYETKDGFNFKSIDKLVSATTSGAEDSSVITYTYNNVIQENSIQNNFTILDYALEKNIDLMKSLRVGMYANKTYFYDLYTNKLDIYAYYLKNEIRSKLGTQDDLVIPSGFEESFSRILVRTSDKGTLDPNDIAGSSGRDNADMAKSFSRYNLLFTQSLNMVVPCNVNLRAGGVVKAQFPKVESSQQTSLDEEQSGKYLIKELRHHFEGNNMVTSLKLVRDSYGLY